MKHVALPVSTLEEASLFSVTMTSTRPLLCLTMIVKDEASSIRDVLLNVLPFVDRWLILDTGSTDGTQVRIGCHYVCQLFKELIKSTAAMFPEKKGKVVEEPFVDFRYMTGTILGLVLTDQHISQSGTSTCCS